MERRNICMALSMMEVSRARGVGTLRQNEARRKGLKDKYGLDPRKGLAHHILGASGELAYCKEFGFEWSASVNTFKAVADVGRHTQIRTRSRRTYELIVRPDDEVDDYFVLVISEDGIRFRIVGWIHGRDSRRQEWWQRYGGRDPAWFVPQARLRSFHIRQPNEQLKLW